MTTSSSAAVHCWLRKLLVCEAAPCHSSTAAWHAVQRLSGVLLMACQPDVTHAGNSLACINCLHKLCHNQPKPLKGLVIVDALFTASCVYYHSSCTALAWNAIHTTQAHRLRPIVIQAHRNTGPSSQTHRLPLHALILTHMCGCRVPGAKCSLKRMLLPQAVIRAHP
jgi:predicted metal-binding protein